MGFSLSRALAGAAMGAAHSAGEIFDGMIAEERKTRESDALLQRQLQIEDHRDQLAADRAERVDEMKASRAQKERDTYGTQMKEVRAKVKGMGLDPDTSKGLQAAAGLADEAGYSAVADKFRVRSELERSHMANEDNRKLQISALHESRAARKRGESEASNNAALARIEKYASTFAIPGERDEDGKVIKDKDEEAVAAARDFAQQELASGASEKSVLSQLAQLRKQFGVIRATDKYKTLSSTDQFEAAINPRAFDEGREKAKGKSTPSPATTTTSIGTRTPDNGGGLWGATKGLLNKLPPFFTDEHL